MLVQDQQPSSVTFQSSSTTYQAIKARADDTGSSRILSSAAEEKLASNPSLARLNTFEKIVTVEGHVSEALVPVIDETRYAQRNYLVRQVVKPSELEYLKGGEKIDLLT